MRHWTGAPTWEEGVEMMAKEPITDPVLAQTLAEIDGACMEFYGRMFSKTSESYWNRIPGVYNGL